MTFWHAHVARYDARTCHSRPVSHPAQTLFLLSRLFYGAAGWGFVGRGEGVRNHTVRTDPFQASWITSGRHGREGRKAFQVALRCRVSKANTPAILRSMIEHELHIVHVPESSPFGRPPMNTV